MTPVDWLDYEAGDRPDPFRPRCFVCGNPIEDGEEFQLVTERLVTRWWHKDCQDRIGEEVGDE